MDKYFIKINEIMYLTYTISETEFITCNEIEWCGRDAKCDDCIFDNEEKTFNPKTIKEFKHKKIDDIEFV